MGKPTYQLVGRRPDRREVLLFRDRKGRHFLRPSCGSKLVRVTNSDAQSIVRQYSYTSVLDGSWHTAVDAAGLECPMMLPEDVLASDATTD